MSVFTIIAPPMSAPERVHAAHRAAKFAFQHEQAVVAELAAVESGSDIDVLALERVGRALEKAEEKTEQAILKYLDAIREWERPRAIAS